MSKEKNVELESMGINAAKRFLIKRGLEIVTDEPFECEAGKVEIITKDEDRGGLVFVKVVTRTNVDDSYPVEKVDEKKRDQLERIAIAFLESYDEADIRIFFDEILITVISSDRALLRHHINMLESCN